MTQPTPLDLLDASHIAALVEVIRADSYVLGLQAEDCEAMSLLAITLAMHRLSCELNQQLLNGNLDERIAASQIVLRETSALLEIVPISQSDVAPNLRLLERLTVLVLEELRDYDPHQPKPEDPF